MKKAIGYGILTFIFVAAVLGILKAVTGYYFTINGDSFNGGIAFLSGLAVFFLTS